MQPVQSAASYDNDGAFKQMLEMMKRGERIDFRFFTSRDNHPSTWAESRNVAGFRLDLSTETFAGIMDYLITGHYELFEKGQVEPDSLVEGSDFQLGLMKDFIESGRVLKYVPLFRDYPDKLTASIPYLKGKIIFRVTRTQELMDYLRENNQPI